MAPEVLLDPDGYMAHGFSRARHLRITHKAAKVRKGEKALQADVEYFSKSKVSGVFSLCGNGMSLTDMTMASVTGAPNSPHLQEHLMRILIRTHLQYAASQPCELLLQIEAMADEHQHVHAVDLKFDGQSVAHPLEGEEGMGTRHWIEAGPDFECRYEAQVDVTRTAKDLAALPQTSRIELPGDVIKYLMPSRYCHPELFLDFVATQFGPLTGGALIHAMRDWIAQNFTYDSAASPAGMTATDSFNNLSGVCRDYAHVLITLARAGGIPARFVSVYAPDVKPQDFHAVAEVFLDGAWHLVDATGMAKPADIVRICVGRDAADASFMTSYGRMDLVEQTVDVRRI